MGRRKLLGKQYYMDYWVDRLTNLVVNMFVWNGLPEEINQAQMEKDIMLGAFSIFFKDTTLGKFFCLPGALSGVDVYGYPTMAKPIPKNGVMFDTYKLGEGAVVIYANRTRTSAMRFIQDYADKLSDLDVAIKMNTLAMKHPIMIKTNEQSKESYDQLMKQYDSEYYVIFTDKTMGIDNGLELLDLHLDSQEILNLQKQKETVINEFFNVFGISGVVEKRERMIAGEMNAMLQQVGINRQMWLSYRENACKEINRLFGLKVSVESTQINFEDFNEDGKADKKEDKEKQNDRNTD